jgi:uridine kinase
MPQTNVVLSQPALVAWLAESIVAIGRSHRVRVGVDGPDAAGKTTLADALAAAVERRGRPVIRASIDDFHRPRAERYRRGAVSPRGYYEDSFDYNVLREALSTRSDPMATGPTAAPPSTSAPTSRRTSPLRSRPTMGS